MNSFDEHLDRIYKEANELQKMFNMHSEPYRKLQEIKDSQIRANVLINYEITKYEQKLRKEKGNG